MPKVSVLVPVYNVERYLSECLDSIVNQTLKDIEIICINDGSTDSSLSILEEYAKNDSRIKIIDKSNSGYGISMNIGLDNATGDYVGIIESDDFADLGMFETLYNMAVENKVDLVKSDWYCYWTKNNSDIKANAISKELSNRVFSTKDEPFVLKMQPAIWSGIYKREFLKENDVRFLETPGASYQDTGFYFKAMMQAKSVIFTTEAFLHYRQDNLNSSVNNKNKVYCICDEYKEIERYIKANRHLVESFLEYSYACRYKAYDWTVYRIAEKFIPDFIDNFAREFKEIDKSEVLGKCFYSQVNKKDFDLLLNNTNKFCKIFLRKIFFRKIRNFRKKLISVNFNSSRKSLVLFGKQIWCEK